MTELRCQQCGGPLILAATGGTAIVSITVTTDQETGQIIDQTPPRAWCATCVREWNQRLAPDQTPDHL